MEARVTQVDGGPGDGGAAFIKDRVVPTLQGDEGFEGILHVADQASGRGYSMVFFRDADALGATDDAASGLREEAGGQGYEVSLLGKFQVDVLETSGEAKVARFVRFRGGPSLGEFIRDRVTPIYQGQDGYVGIIGLSSGDDGVGVSLWASDEAFDAAEDAMRQVGEAMDGAGYQRDSLERLTVGVAQLPS